MNRLLDNEVIFKKAFTNQLVFAQFVKDVIGIDIVVSKIETEKRFKPKMAYIDFSYDIFAESIDNRVIVEIQRVNDRVQSYCSEAGLPASVARKLAIIFDELLNQDGLVCGL